MKWNYELEAHHWEHKLLIFQQKVKWKFQTSRAIGQRRKTWSMSSLTGHKSQFSGTLKPQDFIYAAVLTTR